MAQIIIDIAVEDENWVFSGMTNTGYEATIENPSYDDQIPEDPTTNPSTIPNPQSIEDFTKERLIDHLFNDVRQGYITKRNMEVETEKETKTIT
jgi:hypothetical protein